MNKKLFVLSLAALTSTSAIMAQNNVNGNDENKNDSREKVIQTIDSLAKKNIHMEYRELEASPIPTLDSVRVFGVKFILNESLRKEEEEKERLAKLIAKRKNKTISFLDRYFTNIEIADNDSIKNEEVSLIYKNLILPLRRLNSPDQPERYIAINPDYYRLFIPLTYFESPIDRISKTEWELSLYDKGDKNKDRNYYELPLIENKQRADETVDKTLLQTYLSIPEEIKSIGREIEAIKLYSDEINKDALKLPKINKLFSMSQGAELESDNKLLALKPNWWKFGGSLSIQMSQNAVSKNWYKGGEDNYAGMVHIQLFANYNDKEKTQWENLLEVKTGMSSTPSDNLHSYIITTDLLRLTSKIGMKAASKWYYTASLEGKTQLLDNYKANSDKLVSAFFAPADLLASIGMDYKLKKKAYQLSVFLAPLTYNLRYVGNKDVDETKFGITKGSTTKNNFGSQMLTNFNWVVNKYFTWTTRFQYNTSYQWTRIDWENTFNFILNRYFSTRLYVYSRFDDTVKRVENDSFFQFKEIFSFGINYKW